MGPGQSGHDPHALRLRPYLVVGNSPAGCRAHHISPVLSCKAGTIAGIPQALGCRRHPILQRLPGAVHSALDRIDSESAAADEHPAVLPFARSMGRFVHRSRTPPAPVVETGDCGTGCTGKGTELANSGVD